MKRVNKEIKKLKAEAAQSNQKADKVPFVLTGMPNLTAEGEDKGRPPSPTYSNTSEDEPGLWSSLLHESEQPSYSDGSEDEPEDGLWSSMLHGKEEEEQPKERVDYSMSMTACPQDSEAFSSIDANGDEYLKKQMKKIRPAEHYLKKQIKHLRHALQEGQVIYKADGQR